MGIKEFRDRLSEVTKGTEMIDITHRGRVVGTFTPRLRDPEKIKAAAASIERWQSEMMAQGIDLEAELAGLGLDLWGEPIGDSDRP